MATDWDIREPASRCSLCEKEFAGGQEVHSALVEIEDSFERYDCCEACWQSNRPEAVYSTWRTTTPEREKPIAKRLNSEVVLDFFHRLENEADRRKQSFRYVLALMLLRKKVMRFEGVEREDGAEMMVLRDARSGVPYSVPDLHLAGEELSQMTEEISRLLNINVGRDEREPDAAT